MVWPAMPAPQPKKPRRTFLIELSEAQLREIHEALLAWEAGAEKAKRSGRNEGRTGQAHRLVTMLRVVLEHSGLAPGPPPSGA